MFWYRLVFYSLADEAKMESSTAPKVAPTAPIFLDTARFFAPTAGKPTLHCTKSGTHCTCQISDTKNQVSEGRIQTKKRAEEKGKGTACSVKIASEGMLENRRREGNRRVYEKKTIVLPDTATSPPGTLHSLPPTDQYPLTVLPESDCLMICWSCCVIV